MLSFVFFFVNGALSLPRYMYSSCTFVRYGSIVLKSSWLRYVPVLKLDWFQLIPSRDHHKSK